MRTTVAFVSILASLAVAQAQTDQKKRVAVLNFDYATVYSNVAQIFGTNQDVGKGIADLLVQRLVEGRVYGVYERNQINKVLHEQNFSNSDRADPSTASKIGRILGVDYIIIGSITQFGRDDKNTSVSGSAVSGQLSRWGLGGVGKRDSKAVVQVTARVIDASTGEILATASGTGQSTRSGATLIGGGGSGGTGGRGAFDMSSSNFANTILGEAVGQAVKQLATGVEQQATRLPVRTVSIDGLVADVAGNTLVLNVGTAAGVRVGAKLDVRRVLREVRDPASGKVIRRIEDKVGDVVITEADPQSAVGTFSGAQPAKVGDTVKSPQ